MRQQVFSRGATTLALAALLAAVFMTVRGVGAVDALPLSGGDTAAPFRYFPETGHNLGPPFKPFYDAHGGIAVFGLPLTEALPLTATLSATTTISPSAEFAPTLSTTATISPAAEVNTAAAIRPPLVGGVRAATIALVRAPGAISSPAARTDVESKAATALSTTLPLSATAALSTPAPFSATEALSTGVLVQYFERARLEYHPHAPAEAAIVVADLGRQLSQGRDESAFLPQPPRRSTLELRSEHRPERYFSETGHTLRGTFLSFWQQHGGLPIFGYPLSESLVERDATGAAVTVQYFERARFEYRSTSTAGVAAVQLGLVGREELARRALPPEVSAAVPPVLLLAEAATPAYSSSQESVNIRLAAQRLDGLIVAPGETFSFLDSMGEISEQAGFVSGAGIVAGEIVPVLAGGICQVSSALYAAAFDAGLEIVERQGHSRLLDFFADRPGIEAAVFDPGQDLRWRNDTPQPVFIATRYDKVADQMVVALWGVGAGRTVTVGVPETLEETLPAAADWTLDEALAPGELLQATPPQAGLTVAVWRSLAAASGETIREERVVTRYAPVAEALRYGAGIQPPDADAPACLRVDVTAVGELAQELAPCNTPTPSSEPTSAPVEPTAEQVPTAEPTVEPALTPAEPLPSAELQPTVELAPVPTSEVVQ